MVEQEQAMKLDIYQVDAFAEEVFKGNPAAIIPLEEWLDDVLMQAIALENNLSETVYIIKDSVRGEGCYKLRWFTPGVEVDLCGHATLASAHVIWAMLGEGAERLIFDTRSGDLKVTRGKGGLIEMDFPASPYNEPVEVPGLARFLGVEPVEVLGGSTLMAVLASAADVKALDFNPGDLEGLLAPDYEAELIVTAPGDAEADCVSRFFAPYAGIDEDPVTGSIHTSIVPYWANKLGKVDIVAHQVSPRGGILYCTDAGERTILRGKCTDYMTGVITV